MPDRYAVIGHPIRHSLSPLIHSLFAQSTNQQLTYEAIDGGDQPGAFAQALATFRAAGGLGVNVTLPFKLDALACAHQADDAARLAGAANALRFTGDFIEARNFDGAGLVRDITVNLAQPLQSTRILLLGAGGAARGVVLPLALAGAKHIVIANRTQNKARLLADELIPHVSATCTLEGVGLNNDSILHSAHFDVVINATSASLSGASIGLHDDVLVGTSLAYDMVYGGSLTPFLQQAKKMQVRRLANGIGMLVEQAACAFTWWRGVLPYTAPVIAQLGVN